MPTPLKQPSFEYFEKQRSAVWAWLELAGIILVLLVIAAFVVPFIVLVFWLLFVQGLPMMWGAVYQLLTTGSPR